MRPNYIRAWALAAVAVTSAALITFAWILINILSAPDWCNRALGAAKYADGPPEFAVGGCYSLLTRQVQALAINSHIALGTLALCLAVLTVIVLAGGRLAFTANKDGVTANIDKDVAEAVDEVVEAGAAKADDIKGDLPNG